MQYRSNICRTLPAEPNKQPTTTSQPPGGSTPLMSINRGPLSSHFPHIPPGTQPGVGTLIQGIKPL